MDSYGNLVGVVMLNNLLELLIEELGLLVKLIIEELQYHEQVR